MGNGITHRGGDPIPPTFVVFFITHTHIHGYVHYAFLYREKLDLMENSLQD